jgi:DNA-binding FrmR family transcriptional regulator
MVEEERYCIDVLTQIQAAQAALDNVALGLLHGHVRNCMQHGDSTDRAAKAEELMGAVGRFVRG